MASRVFRVASQLAVVAWGAALLVSARFDATLPDAVEPAGESTARIRPAPEPPPPEIAPPEAPREARPAPEASAEAPAAASDLSRGAALLLGGDFPVLSCSYESFPSFRAYARAMASLGARFVVVRHREIVGSVDVETGALGDPDLNATFSPRARDYTGEPGLAALAQRSRERFGDGAVVMMLVPRALDAGLFGGIARVLAERGDDAGAYREIRGRYERAPGGIRLRLDAGVRPDGTRVDMDGVFDLGAIARAAGAPA